MDTFDWKTMIDLKKSALIVVDMQNDFCHKNGSGALNGNDVTRHYELVPRLQKLIDSAHEAGIPVIFIKTEHDETTDSKVWKSRRKGRKHPTCVKGSWGTEYFGVAPTEKDIEVIKHRYSAFIGTDLELKLRAMGCETLLMTGVSTNVCVESTLRDGFMLDFNVILVEDCCAAANAELHQGTINNVSRHFGYVSNSGELSSMLSGLVSKAAL